MNYLLLTLALMAFSFSTQAHKSSDSYVKLKAASNGFVGQWDIAVRDLDYALGLDTNGDGRIVWGEIRKATDTIRSYVAGRLRVLTEGKVCAVRTGDLKIDEHSDGHYAVLALTITCPAALQQFSIDYNLFFDLDAQHRGLMALEHGSAHETAVFSPERERFEFVVNSARDTWQAISDFAYEGVWHIWIGLDHVLFLLSLLLPAALVRSRNGWIPQTDFKKVFWNVLTVVTSFTIAHSLTLALAASQFIPLPSRRVESAIAASVILAAINNIFPVLTRRRVVLAFCFGLIHGMGIAGVLLDIGLPVENKLLSIVSFNLGVEAGQMAIVGVALPLITWLSRNRYYPAIAMKAGSLGIVVVSLIWLTERSLDIQITF